MIARLGPTTWDDFDGNCVHDLQSHVIVALLDTMAIEIEVRDYLQVIRIEDAIYALAKKAQKPRVLNGCTQMRHEQLPAASARLGDCATWSLIWTAR